MVKLLASGLADDIETGDLTIKLENLARLRSTTLEEATRDGFEAHAEFYNQYKDRKCLYDLSLLVASHRYRSIFTDPRIIRTNIEADHSIFRIAKAKQVLI